MSGHSPSVCGNKPPKGEMSYNLKTSISFLRYLIGCRTKNTKDGNLRPDTNLLQVLRVNITTELLYIFQQLYQASTLPNFYWLLIRIVPYNVLL